MSERMHELMAARRVAPSVLSADFSRLGSQIEEVMEAGARVIHYDVMDGHFVPPITIGPLVLSTIADQVHDAGGAIDVHLMIETPERQVEEFSKAGADSISFHAESTPHANRTLHAIRELGCTAGIAINPGTPVEILGELRGAADVVLCMTVNPVGAARVSSPAHQTRSSGWYLLPGKPGSRSMVELTRRRRARLSLLEPASLVAGSAIFGAPEPAQPIWKSLLPRTSPKP